jgi:hypothetical protein
VGISTPYSSLVVLPHKPPPNNWYSELCGIEPVKDVSGQGPQDDHLFCKVKAGTTNEQFRQWCYSNKTMCLLLNVIMVEITFGGSNAPICHGAGFKTTTLSDLVV